MVILSLSHLFVKAMTQFVNTGTSAVRPRLGSTIIWSTVIDCESSFITYILVRSEDFFVVSVIEPFAFGCFLPNHCTGGISRTSCDSVEVGCMSSRDCAPRWDPDGDGNQNNVLSSNGQNREMF